MKLFMLGALFAATSATALAQSIAPAATPQTPGSAATGTITMSGCVGGGIGSGPLTMLSPTIVPSTVQPGSVASSATSTSSPTVAVGTTGSTRVTATASPSIVQPGGATSLSADAAGPTGYRLSGSDMNSWVGRRVQVVGTLAPVTAETPAAPSASAPAGLQEFRVQNVVPLTGPCPQP